MKKKKAVSKQKNDTKRFVLLFTVMLCLIVSMSTYWIYAYHHKYGKTYFDNKIIGYKISDYVKLEGNTVYLENIDEDINNEFVTLQKEILNNNQIIDVSITKGIYKNILSVKISYTVSKKSVTYEEIITININLEENKKIDNDILLNMIEKEYKSIATDIFNEYIKLPEKTDIEVIDAITEEKLTPKEFNQNNEKYIIRIREKLPDIMTMYINDNKVYYVVKLSEINKLCYYTNTDSSIVVNRKIGEI